MSRGLLDGFDDPKVMGLLSLAGPLLQAGGYSPTPVSLGQAVGAGLTSAGPAMLNATAAQTRNRLLQSQATDAERQAAERASLAARMSSMFLAPPGAPTVANAQRPPPISAFGFSPQQIDALKLLPPEQQAAVLQQRAFAPPEKPTIVPAGATVLGANGQPVYQNPRSDRPNSFETAVNMALDPNASPERRNLARAYVDRLGAPPSTSVTVDAGTKQDTAEAAGYGTALVDEYKIVRDRGLAANDTRSQLSMARAINTIGPDGKELPSALQMQAGNVAAALGINTETPAVKALLGRVTDGQAFVGTLQNLVLTKMQAQKGPQTENDAKRIESTLASLGNTPQARDFLLRSADALAQVDQYQHQFWEEYRANSPKKSFEGASAAWREWRNKTPLLGINPNSNLPVFLPEFIEAARAANPDATEAQILGQWRMKYGRK